MAKETMEKLCFITEALSLSFTEIKSNKYYNKKKEKSDSKGGK